MPSRGAVLVALALGLSAAIAPAASATPAGTPAITLHSPNGFQQWDAGSQRAILYAAVGVDSLDIQASANDGASWFDIAIGVPANGAAVPWTLPLATSSAYRVRIASASDPAVADTSDHAFAVVPPRPPTGLDYVYYRDSANPDAAEWSAGAVSAPSTLELVGGKAPVTPAYALVGSYALRLAWTSEPAGDWSLALTVPGAIARDVTVMDSLILHVFTETTTGGDGLPYLFFRDTANAESDRISMGIFVPEVAGGSWQRLALPLDLFIANPGAADLTQVESLVIGQRTEDQVAHAWHLDDVRITGAAPPDTSRVIVVLGSSTAAGVGASSPDSAWVERYAKFIRQHDPQAVVVNVAVGGYTTYHVQADGYSPPPSRPDPSPGHNMTTALAHDPIAIIVNLPSNDTAFGYSVSEQLANWQRLWDAAGAAGVPIWFTTCQPRDFASQALRDELAAVSDSILARYGGNAVDVYTGMAAPNGTIQPQYASGDGIHINDAGHRLIFERMVARGIWQALTTDVPAAPAGAGTIALLPNAPNPFAGETALRFRLAAPAEVSLRVLDLAGREVAVLARGARAAGEHAVRWRPAGLAPGLYVAELHAGDERLARKLVLAR